MSVHVYVRMCVCGGQRTILGVWSVVHQAPLTFFSFRDRVSNWPSTCQVGWPANLSSWPVSASLALDLQAGVTWPAFKMCFLGIGKPVAD